MRREQKLYFALKLMLLFLVVANVYAEWTKTWVGSAPNALNQLRVGDGRNDGIQRVYAVCEDGHVYEMDIYGRQLHAC